MDSNAFYRRFLPNRTGRYTVNWERKRSTQFDVGNVKPVSSDKRLKSFLIVASVIILIGLVAAISTAIVLTLKSTDADDNNSSALGEMGSQLSSSTQSPEGGIETTTAVQGGDVETTTAVPSVGVETTTAVPSVGVETTTAVPSVGFETTTAVPSVGVETTTAVPSVGVETTTAVPSGSVETTTAAPSGSVETTTAVPSGSVEKTTAVPSVGVETTTAVPSVGVETTTAVPSGIVETTTAVPSGSVETTTAVPSGSVEKTTVVPGATGTWNNWGSWTSCGATCGTGSHTRYRTCLRTSANDPICQGEYVETATCSIAACPVYGVWTTWSGWGVCDVTCGGGTQLRTRVCQKSSSTDLDCVGGSSQSQTCNSWSCPDCSQTCTTGVLNSECTACECTSNTVQGFVRNHVNVPLSEASIAHASIPYKTLATTNEAGGFVLDTTCEAVEIVVTRAGYADVTAVVTGNSVNVQMSLREYPTISMNPKSRQRVQGENVTFCCEAYGNPAISSYEWMKDGVLIDETNYPDGYNLTLNDLTTSDSGEYKCRANSPVRAVYSSSALLTVKSTQSEFCEDAYQQEKISLPSDCVQTDNTTLYDVGGCAKKTCRGSSNEDGLCGSSKKFCCLPSPEEERTVQCNGYTLKVLVITGCSCGECSSSDIKVQGQVNGLNTGVALRLGTIYINGTSVARTTFSGLFSLTLPAGTLSAALTIEDTVFKSLLTTTKVITFDESMEGTVYQKITLMEAAPPITISSDVENTVPMGNTSGMPAMAEMTIPPYSFVDASGNSFNGLVKSSVNIFDPRNLSSISAAPGTFEFTDEEGETQSLQTFGVVVVDFQDESGNKLNVVGNVTLKLDATLVESTYSGNVTDVKLWGLNSVTGQWEEVGPMTLETSTRKRRQTAGSVVVGQVPISAFRAINLDCYRGFSRCYFKTTVKDSSNNIINGYTVRVIHMTYPGERYGSASTYVTAVKEMSSDSGAYQYTFCRNDSWGYIQAYKSTEEYSPGVSSASGLSEAARTYLEYEIVSNPNSLKAKFLFSETGPFVYLNRYQSITNQFQFFEDSATNSFQDYTLIKLDTDPVEAFRMSMRPNANDYGPMLWYPYKNPFTMAEFKICMIKIVVDGPTSGLSFSVRSKAGSESGIVDTILGVRQVAVENGGACVEYKCSGNFPLFQNIIGGVPQMKHDYTKLTIVPVGRFCTVLWESDIKLHSKNAESNNTGLASHEWFIPDTEEHGIYIYEKTESYTTVDWKDAQETTRNMCKEGVKSPSSTANPSMNTVDPALRFRCL